MTDDANGIFEPLFGSTAKEEYLDALEEQPSIDASGHIRFPEEELREKWDKLDRRSKMLLIERLIDELPETRRFLFAFAFDRRRWTGTVNRVGHALWKVIDAAENVTARFVGILVHEAMAEQLRQERAMERLGGDTQGADARAQGRVHRIFRRFRAIVVDTAGWQQAVEQPPAEQPPGNGSTIGFFGVDPKGVPVIGSILSQLKAGGYVS